MCSVPRDVKVEIAAIAARLIAEEGCDYAHAKQRAAEDVLGSQANVRSVLPDNALIELELRRYLQTFAADRHPAQLAALRQLAAQLMTRLARFNPHIVGAVLNGTATGHSDIHLHLFTDSAKDVEMFLINEGVEFDVAGAAGSPGPGEAEETLSFVIEPARGQGMPRRVGVVLSVHGVDAIRVAPRFKSNDPTLHAVEAAGRASLTQLQQLIADRHSSP